MTPHSRSRTRRPGSMPKATGLTAPDQVLFRPSPRVRALWTWLLMRPPSYLLYLGVPWDFLLMSQKSRVLILTHIKAILGKRV